MRVTPEDEEQRITPTSLAGPDPAGDEQASRWCSTNRIRRPVPPRWCRDRRIVLTGEDLVEGYPFVPSAPVADQDHHNPELAEQV